MLIEKLYNGWYRALVGCGMEIYVEYALIENFCVDCALLFLARKISKLPIKKRGLIVGGIIGAAFAVVYPLFVFFLGQTIASVLKAVFPFLICLVGFGGPICKNDGGRYALNVISFYALSFAFAGGVYAVCGFFVIDYAFGDGLFVGAPIGLVFSSGVGVFALSIKLTKGIYARKKQTRFIYPCELVLGDRRVCADGFIDSGNVARRNGKPICFISAALMLELFEENAFFFDDEMAVTTVTGEKKIKLFFLDELRIYCDGERNIISKPYCSVNYKLGTREYKVLLGAWALE